MPWLERFKKGMAKTAHLFTAVHGKSVDLDDLEDALICADVGLSTTQKLLAAVRQGDKKQAPLDIVHDEIVRLLSPVALPLPMPPKDGLFVVMLVGVNGGGKTTTAGKLAAFYQAQHAQVALCAADTFRSGATEQLCRWGERLNVPVYTHDKADPAALVFDAVRRAGQEHKNVLLIDTAGRLQNKKELMAELNKIYRCVEKAGAAATVACWLVLDATVGQNALSQMTAFDRAVPLSGVIMTKLDGSAKGGILLALTAEKALPIYAVGVGENVDDLQSFTAKSYADCLTGKNDEK